MDAAPARRFSYHGVCGLVELPGSLSVGDVMAVVYYRRVGDIGMGIRAILQWRSERK